MRFDAKSAICDILVYREGLLRTIGHDLKLTVGRFEVELEESPFSVSASFHPNTIHAVSAMSQGRENRSQLGAPDLKKIDEVIQREVLETALYPLLRYEGDRLERRRDNHWVVRGTLLLRGVRQPLELVAVREGDDLCVRGVIHQPAFGIRPYRAALGALRVKPDVEVEFSVPFKEVAHALLSEA